MKTALVSLCYCIIYFNMPKEDTYKKLLNEAKADRQLLQEEYSSLLDSTNTNGIEERLNQVKEEWCLKENLLRKLATTNKIEQRNKIRLLRISLAKRLKPTRKPSAKRVDVWSCKVKGRLLLDIINTVKQRRTGFNYWLNNNNFSPSETQEVLQVHREIFRLIQGIQEVVKVVEKAKQKEREIINFKKSTDEVNKFINKHKEILDYWFIKESPSLTAMKQHYPAGKDIINSISVEQAFELKNNSSPNTAVSPANSSANIHPSGTTCKPSQSHNIGLLNKPSPKPNVSIDCHCVNKNSLYTRNLTKVRPTARKGSRFKPITDNPIFNYKIEYVYKKKRILHKENSEGIYSNLQTRQPVVCSQTSERGIQCPSEFSFNNENNNGKQQSSEASHVHNEDVNSAINANIRNSDNEVNNIINEYIVPTPLSNMETESIMSDNLHNKTPHSYGNYYTNISSESQYNVSPFVSDMEEESAMSENSNFPDNNQSNNDVSNIMGSYIVPSPISNIDNESIMSEKYNINSVHGCERRRSSEVSNNHQEDQAVITSNGNYANLNSVTYTTNHVSTANQPPVSDTTTNIQEEANNYNKFSSNIKSTAGNEDFQNFTHYYNESVSDTVSNNKNIYRYKEPSPVNNMETDSTFPTSEEHCITTQKHKCNRQCFAVPERTHAMITHNSQISNHRTTNCTNQQAEDRHLILDLDTASQTQANSFIGGHRAAQYETTEEALDLTKTSVSQTEHQGYEADHAFEIENNADSGDLESQDMNSENERKDLIQANINNNSSVLFQNNPINPCTCCSNFEMPSPYFHSAQNNSVHMKTQGHNWEDSLPGFTVPTNEAIKESTSWIYRHDFIPVPHVLIGNIEFSIGQPVIPQQSSIQVYNMGEHRAWVEPQIYGTHTQQIIPKEIVTSSIVQGNGEYSCTEQYFQEYTSSIVQGNTECSCVDQYTKESNDGCKICYN